MTWMAANLRHRIQIRKAVQTADDNGGYVRTYTTLTTIWAGMSELSQWARNNYVSFIRGASTTESPTHDFVVRKSALYNLGLEFGKAFSSAFDSIQDLMPLKSDYFIFLEQGATVKGRLFQIVDIVRDEKRKEYFKFRAREIEESGTGYAE